MLFCAINPGNEELQFEFVNADAFRSLTAHQRGITFAKHRSQLHCTSFVSKKNIKFASNTAIPLLLILRKYYQPNVPHRSIDEVFWRHS